MKINRMSIQHASEALVAALAQQHGCESTRTTQLKTHIARCAGLGRVAEVMEVARDLGRAPSPVEVGVLRKAKAVLDEDGFLSNIEAVEIAARKMGTELNRQQCLFLSHRLFT